MFFARAGVVECCERHATVADLARGSRLPRWGRFQPKKKSGSTTGRDRELISSVPGGGLLRTPAFTCSVAIEGGLDLFFLCAKKPKLVLLRRVFRAGVLADGVDGGCEPFSSLKSAFLTFPVLCGARSLSFVFCCIKVRVCSNTTSS